MSRTTRRPERTHTAGDGEAIPLPSRLNGTDAQTHSHKTRPNGGQTERSREMLIKETFMYLSDADKKAIEQGIARLVVRSFTLDCSTMGARTDAAEQNKAVLSELEKSGLALGQYHEYKRGDDYSLWFWCNTENGEMRLDYVRLERNNKHGIEENEEIAEKAMRVFEQMQTKDNVVTLQYEAVYDEQRLEEAATRFAEESIGKFVCYNGEVGRIVKIDPEEYNGYGYFFKRKGARTRGYYLDSKKVYSISVTEQEANA